MTLHPYSVASWGAQRGQRSFFVAISINASTSSLGWMSRVSWIYPMTRLSTKTGHTDSRTRWRSTRVKSSADSPEPYGERIIPLAGTGEVIRDNSFLNILGKLPTFGDTLVLGRTNYVVDQARRVALDAGANVVMSEDERLIKDLYDLIKNRPLTFPLEKLDCILGSWVPSKRFWRHGAKKTLRERVGSSSNRWMSWDELYSYGSPDLPRLLKGEVFLDGLREGFDPNRPAVNFMTAHASKGCEKNVIVLRDLGQRVSEGLNLSGENEIRAQAM